MALNPSSKTFRVLFAVVAVLVIYKMIFWFGDKPTTVPHAPLEVSEPTADVEFQQGTVTEDQDASLGHSEAAQPAKRIVQVPDTRNDSSTEDAKSTPREINGINIPARVRELLDSALAGNLGDGYYVNQLKNHCLLWEIDDSMFEKSIENSMEMVERHAQSGDPVPPEGLQIPWLGFTSSIEGAPGVRVFPTEHQNRAHHQEWIIGCQKVNALFSENFRKELEQLARNGHVMARYLYAVWEPGRVVGMQWANKSELRPLESFQPGAFENSLNWQLNALDFSYQNLMEGEIAGLLAFAESYMGGKFTRSDTFLTMSLLKAILICDPSQYRVEELLLLFAPGRTLETLTSNEEANAKIQVVAEELSSYCH